MGRLTRFAMRTSALSLVLFLMAAPSALAQEQSPPIGAEVSVKLVDGTRAKGRLVSLDMTDVVLRRYPQAPEIKHKLADVLRVETIHHNRRNLTLAGLGIGAVVALLGDWCGGSRGNSSPEPDCISAMPALVTAGGAATGALIGHAIDNRRRRVLFVGPARGIARATRPRGIVVGGAIRW